MDCFFFFQEIVWDFYNYLYECNVYKYGTPTDKAAFAENPEKISNIVNGSYKELLSIYDFNKPYFKELNDEYLYVDLNIIKYSFMQYPMALRNHLTNDVFQDDIIDYLTELNRYESIDQTIKGIKTNGIVKSVNYASKKLAKRFKH